MSSPHHLHSSNDSSPEGGVNIKLILVVGIVSLVAFAVCTIIAAMILKRDTAALQAGGTPPIPAHVGKDEIGIVEMVHFDSDFRLEEWRLAKKKHLSSYGWIDQAKGVVHIPIDKAMEEVVSQYAGGAPASPGTK